MYKSKRTFLLINGTYKTIENLIRQPIMKDTEREKKKRFLIYSSS